MIVDTNRASREYHAHCIVRLRLRENLKPFKLFPAKKALESVAIDILSPLTSSKGYNYILVITCRFSRLTRTVQRRSIEAVQVTIGFFDHSV